jgi:hypothetical protein
MSAEADRLLTALDAAADDSARATVMAGCSPELLEEVHAHLVYRQMEAAGEEERAAFDRFTAELDAAPDDDARLRLIEAARADPQRGPTFVQEWTWTRGATTQDHANRYMAMLRESSAVSP